MQHSVRPNYCYEVENRTAAGGWQRGL